VSDDTLGEDAAVEQSSPATGRSLPARYVAGLIGLALLAVLPVPSLLGVESVTLFGTVTITFGLSSYQLLQVAGAFYFAMFAMSWDVVSGYTGQISFGHGFFFALGGYTSALLNLTYGVAPLAAIPAGVAVAALGGGVIGVPALRLRGPYLSLVTLVAPQVLLSVFILFSGTFGGELGLSSPDNLLGVGLGNPVLVYYIAFALFVAILAVLLAVTRSSAGAVFTAIREDEDAVAAAGLNPAKFKTFAFVLSAAVGGLAGAVLVHTPVGNPQPSQLLATQVSIEVIIAAILGGMGTIVGAAIGGLIVYLLPEYLNTVEYVVPVLEAPVSEIDFLLFAVIALVLLFVMPGGVLRAVLRIARDRLSDRRGEGVAADGGRRARTPVEQVRERWRSAVERTLERGPDRERRTTDGRRSDGRRADDRDANRGHENGGDTDEH
jgi:branched-chain amino acid transport system permease protein